MNLIELFVRNPVKVSVGVLLVALFGAIALVRMPMQLIPEVETPTINVETRWPGASPQEVEQEIIIEQEEQLKSVEGVTKLSSESMDSMGRITMEFLIGTDMEEALVKVNSRLQQVREYPEDADQPVISTSNASDRPIAWFMLTARHANNSDYAAFLAEHPDLTEAIEPIRRLHNVGVAALRLRELSKTHPQVTVLLPPDIDVTELRRFAEDEIESRFERVPGVAQADVVGGRIDQLEVIVDPERLAARRITLTQVRNVLRGQNADTSAGDFWEGKRRWVLRVLGQFRSPRQVEDQLLAVRDGAPVFVRDVAEVRLGFRKPDSMVRRFGEYSISVRAMRETGANVLDVMAGLQATMRQVNADILNPRGLELTQVYDETDYIYSAIDLVKDNIFVGGALTMIVLMVFLHLEARTFLVMPLIVTTAVLASYVSSWFFVLCLALIILSGFWFARAALVVGLAIPISIIGTFMVLNVLDRSLNVISLAGLAFAVGMFIDNAIVVLENIYRHHSLGASPLAASVRGTKEVIGAVLASTLTNVAVFLPVVFMQEEAGQLFRDIALAVSGALILSIFVAVTVIPSASARLFRRHDRMEPLEEDGTVGAGRRIDVHNGFNGDGSHRHENLDQRIPEGRFFGPFWARRWAKNIVAPIDLFSSGFSALVIGINRWTARSVARRIAVIVAMVGISLGISWRLWPKVEYLPTGNRNLVFGAIQPPPGYNLDEMMAMGERVEEKLRPFWDVDPESPEADKLAYPVIGDMFFMARGRQVFLGLRAHDPLRAGEFENLVRQQPIDPGVIAVAKQTSLFERGITAGRTIDVEITGPDLRRLVEMGGQVFGQARQVIPQAQVMPVPSLDLGSPEVHVRPKLLQAADMQVTSADLGFAVNALVERKISRPCQSRLLWASSSRSRRSPMSRSIAVLSRSIIANVCGRSRFKCRRLPPWPLRTRCSRSRTRSCGRWSKAASWTEVTRSI
jgi:HAE1 family hydrophobic/amphiphilic exporter-1